MAFCSLLFDLSFSSLVLSVVFFSFCSAKFSELFQLFHCNPGIVTREKVSSCFGCTIADALPLCRIVQKSFQNLFRVIFFTTITPHSHFLLQNDKSCLLPVKDQLDVYCSVKASDAKKQTNRRTQQKNIFCWSLQCCNLSVMSSTSAPLQSPVSWYKQLKSHICKQSRGSRINTGHLQ